MDYKWILTWMLIFLRHLGECLKCFECDNKINPACGVEFKSYQFQAHHCEHEMVKCGLQRQNPQPEKDNFIGILRRCYPLGLLSDINETDGCHIINVPPDNYTFQLCFCSEDYCNATPGQSCDTIPILLCACLLFYILMNVYR